MEKVPDEKNRGTNESKVKGNGKTTSPKRTKDASKASHQMSPPIHIYDFLKNPSDKSGTSTPQKAKTFKPKASGKISFDQGRKLGGDRKSKVYGKLAQDDMRSMVSGDAEKSKLESKFYGNASKDYHRLGLKPKGRMVHVKDRSMNKRTIPEISSPFTSQPSSSKPITYLPAFSSSGEPTDLTSSSSDCPITTASKSQGFRFISPSVPVVSLHHASCISCDECKGVRSKSKHCIESPPLQRKNVSPMRNRPNSSESKIDPNYILQTKYSVLDDSFKEFPTNKKQSEPVVKVYDPVREQETSDNALQNCCDSDVKKMLSYERLNSFYNTLSGIGESADNTTSYSASLDEQRRTFIAFPNRLLEKCWYLSCKVENELKGCSICLLTYCVAHIFQDVHGCFPKDSEFGVVLRKPGADHASLRVRRLGREIERKVINPSICECTGTCHRCKFAKTYIKLFAPKSTTVSCDSQLYVDPDNDMDTNGNGKRGIPKLRDIIRRQRQDSDGGGADSPDLDFVYDDTDTAANEIAELYSYTEQTEFQLNVKAFEDQMEQYNFLPSWQKLSLNAQKSVIMKLLDQLEISNKVLRMRAARCILYICQGCWAEVQSDTEQQEWAHRNSLLLYELGIFSAFTDLLNIEIENSAAAHVAMRKLAVSLADSQDLRIILSVLYTITEAIRNEKNSDSIEHKLKVESFTNEIVNATGDDLLVIKLLSMVTRFCSGAAPHFPMKKVLLLLWKLILVSLGGMDELRKAKMEKRIKADLSPLDEDTMEIAKNMRASSPPASASDLLETQNQKRNIRMFRRNLMKQSSLDDHDSITMVLEGGISGIGEEIMKELSEYDERRPMDSNERQMYGDYQQRPMTPPIQLPVPRGLPWKPKVRQRDVDVFLKNARMKFIGYCLQDDRESLAGLPQPIHEGVKTLKEHMYTSLADLQIQKEEEIARNPLSSKEEEIELTPTEVLYQAMLPNLPQYMIALLKILLAAAPTSKAKTDSINIMSDVLPEEMPMTVVQSMKLGLDVNRHKEIIVKAVSAILLLLLKHFKLNHVCQFEFMSQHLVFANCIPLVLKFFNQNVMSFVAAINMIPILDFPACVIGDQPELTAESLEIGYAAPYSWRNIYSCINLLRILNKLTKWKHSRIMMLVVFKSAPILKRTLKVRHAMTQLYVLKLLKMQTKYLGRQWRKSNMKTISAIYAKVRHHLNDDWAFGNDLDARPWDFQGEECALRASVDRFNNRRYTTHTKDIDFESVDNCLNSVLGTKHDLSDNFKKHYHLWLEQEVYNVSINWDKLLLN